MSARGHRFHPTILREYDIRGIVGETLFARDAEAIGRAFGSMVADAGGRRIVLGRDGRLSSPELAEALGEGLVASGIEVMDIGVGPTPMMYFAVHYLGADAGIQVTGSHNPPTHNGFKMMFGRSPFFGERIRELGLRAAAGDFRSAQGKMTRVDVFSAYVERLTSDFHGTRPIDVVWDAGNGAAGPVMEALAARIPGRALCLFAEIDGRFPHHHPDPTVLDNLADLRRTVVAGEYEIGIGFDGDGDRIGVVDGRGRVVFGDQLLMILAEDVLARRPGSTIIADVKASQELFDRIAALGGRPVMWKTGHSLIKAKMAELGAPLAGEMSGHIFYRDGFYGHDDALYVAVRLLDILARGRATLAEIRDRLPQVHNTPEIRFDCPEERKFLVVERVRAALEAEGAEMDTTDGVRVRRGDGWWLLRASNTQAVLVVRAESRTPEGLERLKEEIVDRLGREGLAPPPGF
ncbi:Phosphomannomutase/phosphoglucomutase [bacterium HR40]|nr:Phosphomannomutase/phosphoglucomutase [bacterium HR40]